MGAQIERESSKSDSLTASFGRAEKLENVLIANGKLRLGLFSGGMRQGGKFISVEGKPGPLEVQCRDLALKHPHRPIAANALNFVEGTLDRIFKLEQKLDMAVGESIQGRTGLRLVFGLRSFMIPESRRETTDSMKAAADQNASAKAPTGRQPVRPDYVCSSYIQSKHGGIFAMG